MLSVSLAYRVLFTAGLLRPLEDFGLVKCISEQLLSLFLAIRVEDNSQDSQLFLGFNPS